MRQVLDRFFGSGSAAVTVPPMDGALRPNQALEEGDFVAGVDRPDSVVVAGGRLLASSGTCLIEPAGGDRKVFADFGAEVRACASSQAGLVAAGLPDGSIVVTDAAGTVVRKIAAQAGVSCLSALLFESESVLLACNGSAQHRRENWKHDLMAGGSTGSVWRIDLGSGAWSKIADGIAFPYGLARAADGGVVVSESWRHRLVRVGGRRAVVFDDLPGYPARLRPASGGGYWLSVFAPRSQLIEFVLKDKSYRHEMMTTIDPDLWIAPSMHAPRSFREPLQGGALKHLGILKPWAPTRSYGLVVRLDASFFPIASLHSRADGRFHGVTDCVENDGQLFCVSSGSGEVRSVALEDLEG